MILAVHVAACAPAGPRFRHGINAGGALDAPREGDWGVVLAPEFFEAARVAGFDHVRIPARLSGHALASAPYAIDEAFLARVDWAVDQALARGMGAIVDVHGYAELVDDPDAHRARYLALIEQVAARLARRSDGVALELLNEPHAKLTSARWNDLLAEAIAVVRRVDRERTLVVDGASWASAKGLADLALPADAHLYASFHMYEPMLFTHQGTPWMPAEFATVGVVFPGPPAGPVSLAPAARAVSWVADWFARYEHASAEDNPSSIATIRREFDRAVSFRDRTGVPVYVGEFGACDRADPASRAAWLRAVREEAERRGFGWALWSDGAAFSAYDAKARVVREQIRAALFTPSPTSKNEN